MAPYYYQTLHYSTCKQNTNTKQQPNKIQQNINQIQQHNSIIQNIAYHTEQHNITQYNIITELVITKMGNNQTHRINRQGNLGPEPRHRPVPHNQMKCPKCQMILPPGTTIQNFAQHISGCMAASHNVNGNLGNSKIKEKYQNIQYEKVPIDYTMTKFKWQKKPLKPIDPKIFSLQPNEVKKLSFQQKEAWFRNKLERKRISWEKGADFMKLERSNILMSSLIEYVKVNMHKEVKIEFIGEKVNDAGGLLRQWIHMVIKQVFDQSTGIFTIANTDDIMYKLKWDEDLDEQFSSQLFMLFGTIIGKAIFQKIPIQCYLDRTILRQICGDPVKIQDIYGYDKQLYKNWLFVLETDHLDDLETYFVIHKNTGDTIQEIQLMEGGKDILVANQNKFQYVDLCIQTQTMTKVKRSIQNIKKGVMRVIPDNLLSIFEPYEMQMVLYGVPFIDIKDWRENTTYKSPYSENHQVIRWFWKIMEQFDQDQLAHILHFCTGSSRTPIYGFKKLQSNRGNYSKFLIESSPYHKENPYPKGHTCFNRLQLPMYPDQKSLRTFLTIISKSNLDGVFGLD